MVRTPTLRRRLLPPHSTPPRHQPRTLSRTSSLAIRLLELFAQDTSQAARKRKSWSSTVHLVNELELYRAAALAPAIISAVGAEHADKVGESTSSALPLLSTAAAFHFDALLLLISESARTLAWSFFPQPGAPILLVTPASTLQLRTLWERTDIFHSTPGHRFTLFASSTRHQRSGEATPHCQSQFQDRHRRR